MKAKKELMLSAPIFNKKNIVRGFDPGLMEKILQLNAQPEFQWQEDHTIYEQDSDGSPAVRVSVAGCPVDFDLWAGLRNPAIVGVFPAGFREI